MSPITIAAVKEQAGEIPIHAAIHAQLQSRNARTTTRRLISHTKERWYPTTGRMECQCLATLASHGHLMHLGGWIPPFLAQPPPSDCDDSSVPPFEKMMVFPIL